MKIGLLVTGYKGELFLQGIPERHLNNIEFIMSYGSEEIKEFAEKRNIPFYEEKKEIPENDAYFVDKIIVIGWQYLLKTHLDKLIVFHDSYLPEYKGWAPTVNALINGEKSIGATAFRPTLKMDTGMVYKRLRKEISYPIKISKAFDNIVELYLELFELIITEEVNDKTVFDMGYYKFSYSPWRDEKDYYIDWTKDVEYINRFIDAVDFPYDGAKTKIYGTNKIVTIYSSTIYEYEIDGIEGHAGKQLLIRKDRPVVICGKGLLKIDYMKIDGKEQKLFKNFKTRLV